MIAISRFSRDKKTTLFGGGEAFRHFSTKFFRTSAVLFGLGSKSQDSHAIDNKGNCTKLRTFLIEKKIILGQNLQEEPIFGFSAIALLKPFVKLRYRFY